jgi:hypothetical protein
MLEHHHAGTARKRGNQRAQAVRSGAQAARAKRTRHGATLYRKSKAALAHKKSEKNATRLAHFKKSMHNLVPLLLNTKRRESETTGKALAEKEVKQK